MLNAEVIAFVEEFGKQIVTALVKHIVVEIDFGLSTQNDDTVYTTVPVTWVAEDSVLIATVAGPTADHDLEDGAIENITFSIGNIVPGVSFELIANAPLTSWGKYLVNIVGV